MNGYFILAVAICVASIAAYYSIIGLATIFAAATIPVIIMGAALEVSKLVTAAWLHENWTKIPFLLKSYLTAAVVVLMFITSMGIFGFLSKAHIEQTGNATQQVARVEQIDKELLQLDALILQKETKIEDISSKGANDFNLVQEQITKEQANIDLVYSRISPEVDRLTLITDDATKKKQSYDDINRFLAEGNISEVQRIIGVEVDGNLGPKTRAAIDSYLANQQSEVSRLDSVISENEARIRELKASIEPLIKESTDLISRLRSQINLTDNSTVDTEVSVLETEIAKHVEDKSVLVSEKFELENEIRKFEVEVGPIKYLADLFYDNPDSDSLEDAVKIVILIIIFVFDPLAVLLVLAASMTIREKSRSNRVHTKDEQVFMKDELPENSYDTFVDISEDGNRYKNVTPVSNENKKSSQSILKSINNSIKTNSRNIKYFFGSKDSTKNKG
jgi:hypothetical protein